MLQLMKPLGNYIVPYDEAVAEAKKIMSDISMRQWKLGDLAKRIEPKYGEQTLTKFAKDIGLSPKTIYRYINVLEAWPEMSRPRDFSFSTACELATLPNKEAIVAGNPNITATQARKLREEIRKDQQEEKEEEIFPYQEPCTDCNTAEEQWQRSASNLFGDILSMQAYWEHLFGADWYKYKVPSSLIKLATDAKKELTKMVAVLMEHSRDTKN